VERSDDARGVRNLQPPALFAGAPYTYATVAVRQGLVLTAGACPLDGDGRVVAPGDHAVQARCALANLLTVLADAGAGPEHVLKTTVYAVARDRAELVHVWDAVAAGLAPHRPPSTLLGVALLGYPDQLVEIEAVAVVGAPAGDARAG
jgi:enamine deaminase RidA (YjgF/YER057c/UK114 family)